MAGIAKTWLILGAAALLPLAGCTTDRNDDEEMSEAADTSRMPAYDVTLPDVDVDVDSATIPVPDIDIERPGKIERKD